MGKTTGGRRQHPRAFCSAKCRKIECIRAWREIQTAKEIANLPPEFVGLAIDYRLINQERDVARNPWNWKTRKPGYDQERIRQWVTK